MKKIVTVIVVCLMTLLLNSTSYAMTQAEEKLLFQTLGEIKGELKQINRRIEDVNKRMEDINKRIEDINKRIDDTNRRIDDLRSEVNKRFELVDEKFEQIDKRFEEVNERFKEFFGYIRLMLIGTFGLIGIFVGLLIWDRKTAMKEAKREVYKEMNQEVAPEKFVKVLAGLRKLAEKDKDLFEFLKKEGLL